MSGHMRSARNRMSVSYCVDLFTGNSQIASSTNSASLDDAQVTKALVSLLLTLNARQKGSVKIVSVPTNSSHLAMTAFLHVKLTHSFDSQIRKLSQDVHYHLGDIDEASFI